MTLSEASVQLKGAVKWLGIFFGGLLILWVIFIVFNVFKNIFFPTPPPPPQVGFGKLPPPDFVLNANNKYAYSIDTLSGKLPVFPNQIKVYQMEENKADLLGLSKANSLVANVGFTDPPTAISQNVYQWTNEDKTLTMNINELDFNLSSNFLASSTPTFSHTTDEAKDTAISFLQNIGLFPQDADSTLIQTGIYQIKNYSLVPATSLSNTQAVGVSFFQKNIDGLSIFYPEFSISPMNFLVGESKGTLDVVESNFFHQKSGTVGSTYPIKTSNEAFAELKKGKAFIAKGPDQKTVNIKNILLGYYISDKKQNFLEPVFVFEGDDFAAYVPAILGQWLNK